MIGRRMEDRPVRCREASRGDRPVRFREDSRWGQRNHGWRCGVGIVGIDGERPEDLVGDSVKCSFGLVYQPCRMMAGASESHNEPGCGKPWRSRCLD